MAEQKQGDHFEPTFSSSVRIRSVALRTRRMRFAIGRGGERGSRIFVLMTRQDDYAYETDLEYHRSSFSNVQSTIGLTVIAIKTDTVTRVEILNETLISHSAKNQLESYKSNYSPSPAMSK